MCRSLTESRKKLRHDLKSLGLGSGVSYAWTRPLDGPLSEKSVASQRIEDPLYKPHPRAETVNALMQSVAMSIARWDTLLLQVGAASNGFGLPSYVELPKPEESSLEFNTDLDQRGIIDRLIEESGRRREDITEREWQLLRQIEANNQSNIRNPFMTVGTYGN
jgi:hypothetical protein